jgi:hypothetical protein
MTTRNRSQSRPRLVFALELRLRCTACAVVRYPDPPTMTIRAPCWFIHLVAYTILPSVRQGDPSRTTGPTATLTAASMGHTRCSSPLRPPMATSNLTFSTWRTFTPLTMGEGREQYTVPEFAPDVRI